jgi:hypothetical protein
MDIWQRPVILKITCNFTILGRVMRERIGLDFSGSSEGDRRVVVIYLTLIASTPSSTRAT